MSSGMYAIIRHFFPNKLMAEKGIHLFVEKDPFISSRNNQFLGFGNSFSWSKHLSKNLVMPGSFFFLFFVFFSFFFFFFNPPLKINVRFWSMKLEHIQTPELVTFFSFFFAVLHFVCIVRNDCFWQVNEGISFG